MSLKHVRDLISSPDFWKSDTRGRTENLVTAVRLIVNHLDRDSRDPNKYTDDPAEVAAPSGGCSTHPSCMRCAQQDAEIDRLRTTGGDLNSRLLQLTEMNDNQAKMIQERDGIIQGHLGHIYALRKAYDKLSADRVKDNEEHISNLKALNIFIEHLKKECEEKDNIIKLRNSECERRSIHLAEKEAEIQNLKLRLDSYRHGPSKVTEADLQPTVENIKKAAESADPTTRPSATREVLQKFINSMQWEECVAYSQKELKDIVIGNLQGFCNLLDVTGLSK